MRRTLVCLFCCANLAFCVDATSGTVARAPCFDSQLLVSVRESLLIFAILLFGSRVNCFSSQVLLSVREVMFSVRESLCRFANPCSCWRILVPVGESFGFGSRALVPVGESLFLLANPWFQFASPLFLFANPDISVDWQLVDPV